MRLLAIFPLLCAIVSFVLAMLCLFAGSSPGYLENADLFTLNVSLLGEFNFNTTSSSSSGGSSISSWLHGIGSEIEGDIESEIEKGLNGLIEDVAKALNIHDFYSAHLLDYCEGYYTPSPLTNATSTPSKNITRCSNHTSLFTFDPTAILQSELRPGLNLTDLKWPKEIQDAIAAVEVASKATFVLYCLGIAFAGSAILGALVGFFMGGRFSALVNCMIAFLAFLTLGIASAVVTATIIKICDAINKYGNEINAYAYRGNTFITWTWVATAMMFVAVLAWIVEFCIGRRGQVKGVRNGEKVRY